MPAFDQAYIDDIATRVRSLAADATPNWGKMSPSQMLGHVTMVYRYTSGEGDRVPPDKSSFYTRTFFKPLILFGLVKIPHNVRVPRPKDGPPPPTPEATADELVAAMQGFYDGLQAGTLTPKLHPFFGTMSPKEWSRFHLAHTRHHLEQFGLF